MKIISQNKILYNGIELEVPPEFIQDAWHGIIISPEEAINHIERQYQNKLSEIREGKINRILKK